MKSLLLIIGTICELLFAGSCGNSSKPNTEWETSTPEAQGFDSVQLTKLLSTITENKFDVHSIFIVRNGRVVLDATFYPFVLTEGLHDIASDTKSVTATLIGIAIDKGYIKSVNQKVLEFFPDRTIENRDTNKENITVEDLLTMRSGFNCGHEDEKELMEMIHQSDKEWVQYILDLPMESEPGKNFVYCSPNTHLLSAILTRATGMSELEFAKTVLFEPLGIKDLIWPSDPQGITHGWGDLFLHPNDMAKIGYLYLSNGIWNGQRVVSSGWLEKSLKKYTSVSDTVGYGYSWRFPEEFPGLYYASGRGGQYIIIWPDNNLVIALTGGQDHLDDFKALLVASLKSDKAITENPEGLKALQEEIEKIKNGPTPEQVPALPAMATTISGKKYILDDNYIGVKSVSFNFSGGNEVELDANTYDNLSGTENNRTLSVGLDNVYRVFPDFQYTTPGGLKGYWAPDDKFVLYIRAIAGFYSLKLELQFADDGVTIDINEESGLFSQTITGIVSTNP